MYQQQQQQHEQHARLLPAASSVLFQLVFRCDSGRNYTPRRRQRAGSQWEAAARVTDRRRRKTSHSGAKKKKNRRQQSRGTKGNLKALFTKVHVLPARSHAKFGRSRGRDDNGDALSGKEGWRMYA